MTDAPSFTVRYPPAFDAEEQIWTAKGHLTVTIELRGASDETVALTFVDPVRLAQDVEVELGPEGSVFFEPRLVVVSQVDRAAIEDAVRTLLVNGRIDDGLAPQRSDAVATTPFGPNGRYTIKAHVVGEDRDVLGSVRGADRDVEARVVTPLGPLRAAVLFDAWFRETEPRSVFREIDIERVEWEFEVEPGDVQDHESLAR